MTTSPFRRPAFPKKTYRYHCLILIFCLTVALTTAPAFAAEPATESHRNTPVLWKNYEPVHRDVIACIAGSEKERLTDSVCDRIHERQDRMLWDAIKQSVFLNVGPPAHASYCSPHIDQIIATQNRADGITVATYSIEAQLNGDRGSYGADLPNTELRKIVFDGLVRANPC
jgi:hypothetical protein